MIDLQLTPADRSRDEFLQPWFESKSDDLYALIWALADKTSHWCRTLGEAQYFAANLAAGNTYVGVGLAAKDHGPDHRCPASEIAGVVAIAIDIDVQSAVHRKQNLPPTREDALTLIPADLKPTMVVDTGHGIQAWYAYPEPFIFESDSDRARAEAAAKAMHESFKRRAAARDGRWTRLGTWRGSCGCPAP